MGTVLQFSEIYRARIPNDGIGDELSEEAVRTSETGERHAQIIIFPGVRIERSGEHTECSADPSWSATKPREV